MWGERSVSTPASTIDEAEVARFAALAEEWWDPRGKMAVLHKFNPVRLAYIRDAACRRFGRNPKQLDSLNGLRILDIGCGGGNPRGAPGRLGGEVVGAGPAGEKKAAAEPPPRPGGRRGGCRRPTPGGAGGGARRLRPRP